MTVVSRWMLNLCVWICGYLKHLLNNIVLIIYFLIWFSYISNRTPSYFKQYALCQLFHSLKWWWGKISEDKVVVGWLVSMTTHCFSCFSNCCVLPFFMIYVTYSYCYNENTFLCSLLHLFYYYCDSLRLRNYCSVRRRAVILCSKCLCRFCFVLFVWINGSKCS